MKIADVTVGTEYAAVSYNTTRDTEWSLLERSHRVIVRAIHKGGKITVSRWDVSKQAFYDTSSGSTARNLVMPWKDAAPIRKEIREDRAKSAQLRQEQMAREQVALRAVGEFLENHDALGMQGLPYSLRGAIALANGDEGLKDLGIGLGERPTHRHDPKVEVNVITLLALLRMAYKDGFDQYPANPAPWSQEVAQ